MKKIIAILIIATLLLAGCGGTEPITEQDLIDSGYVINNNNHYKKSFDDGISTMVLLSEDGAAAIGIGLYYSPTSYQTIGLEYHFDQSEWASYYWVGEENGEKIEAKDAYAYISEISPAASEELKYLANSKNISMSELDGGVATNIEPLLAEDYLIENLKVSKSTYTNQYIEEEFEEGEYFIQVNYELTNNSGKDVKLDELQIKLCYEIPTGNACSGLSDMGDGDTNLYDQTINSGSTISIQQTAHVPKDASNFYIQIEGMFENESFYESYPVNFE